MAQATAPLFAFGARGQLAKVLVYSNWKGIDTVRQYVTPANPNSAGQQTQRGYFGDAVDLWHTLGLTATDTEAWNRYASTRPTPQSGFNAFVSSYIDLRVGGLSAAATAMGFNGDVVDSGAGQVDMTIEEDGSAVAVDFLWGYSPTSLINVAPASETANVWDAANVAVASGAIVYARARIEDGANNPIGWSGIYRFGPTS